MDIPILPNSPPAAAVASLPPHSPPPVPPSAQSILDGEHLRLLAIFHYIVGGLIILFSSLFIIHFIIGAAMFFHPGVFPPQPPPRMEFHPSHPPVTSFDPAPPEADQAPDAAPAPPHSRHQGSPPPRWFGLLFMGLGAAAVLIGWSIGGLVIASGVCLGRRRHRIFSIVVASLSCLQIPFGTVLGVFTLVVLLRPGVVTLYPPPALPHH